MKTAHMQKVCSACLSCSPGSGTGEPRGTGDAIVGANTVQRLFWGVNRTPDSVSLRSQVRRAAASSEIWTSQASDGGVRDHSFLGTSVMYAYPAYSTEYRIGHPPIAYSVENAGTTYITLCETARFALCLLRDLSCSQAPPASPTRATLALVFPAGWGQTRHVDKPTHPQRRGYVAG